MKALSGLDATFLYLETAETPMHIGSLCLYELPPGFEGSFHRAVRDHIARRMHLAPIFHRRLAFVPFDLGHPFWVEAGDIALDRHIRKVPGTQLSVRAVEAMSARLHGELIDRERPLWVFHIFDSVRRPDGSRCAAMYSKIHHAALDGKGGTVLANAILDLGPTPRSVPPPDAPSAGAGDLKVGKLLGAVFSNSLAQYAKLARSLPAAAGSIGSTVARRSVGELAQGGSAKMPLKLAPRSLFNAGITAERSFATASLPFADCKTMARAVGGSFNDVVLWLCSTALRTFLARRSALPDASLVAAMPVSLRADGNQELNNQASISLVELGTQLGDPLRRMQAIMASTGKVKQALVDLKSVLPTDYPSLLAPWLVGGAARLAFKAYGKSGLADRLPMVANLAISNVPGPPVPLYLAGARMLSFHPLSIVTHGLALNITIQTYAGQVDFGLIADRKAVPDVQELADGLLQAFGEARALFDSTDRAAAPPAARKARVRAVRAPAAQPAADSRTARPRARARKAATVAGSSTTQKQKARRA